MLFNENGLCRNGGAFLCLSMGGWVFRKSRVPWVLIICGEGTEDAINSRLTRKVALQKVHLSTRSSTTRYSWI